MISTAEKMRDKLWARLVTRLQEPVLNHQTSQRTITQLRQAVTDGHIKHVKELMLVLTRKGATPETCPVLTDAIKVVHDNVADVEELLHKALQMHNPAKVDTELKGNPELFSRDVFQLWAAASIAAQCVLDARADCVVVVDGADTAILAPTLGKVVARGTCTMTASF